MHAYLLSRYLYEYELLSDSVMYRTTTFHSDLTVVPPVLTPLLI